MPININTVALLDTDTYVRWYERDRSIKPIDINQASLGSSSTYQPTYLKLMFNGDNTVYAYYASNTVYIYDAATFNEITTIVCSGTVKSIQFNNDSSELAIHSATNGFRIFETTTWTEVFDLTAASADAGGSMNFASIDPTFSYVFAYVTTSSSNIRLFDISDRTSVTSVLVSNVISYTQVKWVGFTPDLTKVIILSDNADSLAEFEYYDIINATTDSFPSYRAGSIFGGGGVWSDDGTKLYLGCDTGVWVVDGNTLADLDFITIPNSIPIPLVTDVQRVDNLLYILTSTNPGLYVFNLDTNKEEYIVYGRFQHMAVANSAQSYEVKGTITETLVNSKWFCGAYELKGGALINSVLTETSTFSIPLATNTPVIVMIYPVPATRWLQGETYVLDDEIYPTNPDNTPFYYKCTTAGVSSASEPVWTTTPDGDTTDGTVTWTLVERIPQPVAHMPLTPTPVV